MQIKSGMTRTVFCFSKIVIKIPNITSPKKFIGGLYSNFFEPLEYLFYDNHKLGKIYFFIPCFCIVMKRYEEISVSQFIAEESRIKEYFSDCHCRQDIYRFNVGVELDKYVLIDYSPSLRIDPLGIKFFSGLFLKNKVKNENKRRIIEPIDGSSSRRGEQPNQPDYICEPAIQVRETINN